MEWELAHKESWALKDWCFELRCWRRLLRVPWTARRSNQSILKEISPEYSLEELILKLKLQYFGLLMQRTDSLEKTLMLVKTEGRRMDDKGWDGRMASPTWWTSSNASSRSWWWTGKPGMLQSMGFQKVGHNWATELNWPCGAFIPLAVTIWTFSFAGHFPWRRKWQPTPVSLPGNFHEWRSLAGYSPWGCRVGHDWMTSLSLSLTKKIGSSGFCFLYIMHQQYTFSIRKPIYPLFISLLI